MGRVEMLPLMSSDEVKSFKTTLKTAAVPEMRRRIGAAASASGVRVLSLEERPDGRSSTKVEWSVAGHPSQIREFGEELYPGQSWLSMGGGDLVDVAVEAAMDLVGEPLLKAVSERWHRRRDPPFPEDVVPGPGEARTTVTWKWERLLPDGDAVGPVAVCAYGAGQDEPTTVNEWPQWVKRSEAQAFAKEHSFVFEPHDLPDE
jgi:hypothetical protein